MTLDMHDARFVTLGQLEAFTNASGGLNFVGLKRKEKYDWIEKLLSRFFYFSLRRRDKTTIRKYIGKMTGYEDAQLTRLIRKKNITKHIVPSSRETCASFATKYTTDDVALLAKTDDVHLRLSGPATKRLFERAFRLFHDERFVRLQDISVAHIYRLRGRKQYIAATTTFTRTNPTTFLSVNEENPSQKANLAIFGSILCIRAIKTKRRACITSTSSMR